MNRYLLSVLVFVFSFCALSAQTEKKNYDFSLNVIPYFRMFNANSGNSGTFFSLLRKIYEKTSLRFGLSFATHSTSSLLNDPSLLSFATSDSTFNIRQNRNDGGNVALRLGFQRNLKMKSKKIEAYIGADLFGGYGNSRAYQGQYLYRRNSQGIFVLDNNNIVEPHYYITDAFSAGVSPFLGMKWLFSSRFFVGWEFAADYSYLHEKNRTTHQNKNTFNFDIQPRIMLGVTSKK